MHAWLVLLAVVAYIGCLFAIASWGDRENASGKARAYDPWVYSLSLAVYCTSWTFFGAVGTAAGSGWEYLAIYLGPFLVLTVFHPVFRRMVETGKRQHTTSIADFISARYGKSQSVAALVTSIAAFGAIPYIALQLKSVATSFTALTASTPDAGATAPGDETVLLTALALGFFAILFGTRHADVTRHNRGMILAIAFESAVKLAALAAIGCLAAVLLMGPPTLATAPATASPFAWSDFDDRFWTLTLLSMGAILCLPRQFHVAVVECQDRASLGTARWLFPAYLALTSLVVIPITLVGLDRLGASGAHPDLFVLWLPLQLEQPSLALLAFIGGFSAATGMVIVATVALSTMITNDLVAPLLLRRHPAGPDEGRDLARRLRSVRRGVIVGLLAAAYLFQSGVESGETLASLGIVSFAAAVQFAPALIGGLYWRGGRKLGVVLGLGAGFAVWFLTLMLPAYGGWGDAGALMAGFAPFGFDSLTQGVMLSLALNIGLYVFGSYIAQDSVSERLQAADFVADGPKRLTGRPGRASRLLTRDIRHLLERCLGQQATDDAFQAFRLLTGRTPNDSETADEDLVVFAEGQLARVIGAPSARILLAGVLNRRGLPVEDVVALIDETSQTIQFSRDLLQTTLETIPQGVAVIDEKQDLVAWNTAYAKLFAYPAELLRVGCPVADLIRFNAERGECGPGDVEQHVAKRVAHLRFGLPHVSERERPGGRVLRIEGTPMAGGGYVTTFTDVTHQKQTEAALVESERSIRFYTDTMPALIAFIDNRRCLQFANKAYLDRYGPQGALIGNPIESYLSPEDLSFRGASIDAALRGQRVTFDTEWTRPSGEGVHMQVTYTPQRDENGRVSGFFALYQDITARRAAEIALQTTNESLEQRVAERTEELSHTADALAEATRSKTRFLAAASHDLLQPLNAARLFTSALREDLSAQAPDLERLASNIDKSIGAADRLLRALLDISKLDAGGLEPNLTNFRLGDAFEELAIEFGPMAAEKGLKLRVLPSDARIRSDRGLLQSVLQNLVSNAVRYTEAGGVVLGARRRGDTLRLEVWDSGPGIPENRREAIFREFHRLERDAGRTDGGMGLGLAITRRIADLLGHPLALSSVPGRGSVFRVTVPIADAKEAVAPTPIRATGPAPFAGLRVVCLDDERSVLEGLEALLARWGCRVETASTPPDAQSIAASGDRPDIVLLDYHFAADTTGPEVFDRMAAEWPALPAAILITADRTPEVEAVARERGMGLLHKPVEASALRALMAALIRQAAE